MCVIVHQPKGAHIDKETCRLLWKANPDGGGFAFIDDDGKLNVTKAMDFKTYWSWFEQARSANTDTDFMLHMRIATHGSVKIENVHPFVVDDFTMMAHNGIMHGVPDYKDDRTDTQVFISDVLPQLPAGWQDNFYLNDMVQDWIGWSKLMFITVSPLLNENVYRLGDWHEHKGLYLTNLNGLFTVKPTFKKPVAAIEAWKQPNYYESSESWNDWWEMDKDGEDRLEEDIKTERKSMAIYHPIIAGGSGDFDCYGCNAAIDYETAECQCWELVCGHCWKFVANCSLEGTCLTSTHFQFDELNKEEQAYVNGQSNDSKKILELVLPEGAENMKNQPGSYPSF